VSRRFLDGGIIGEGGIYLACPVRVECILGEGVHFGGGGACWTGLWRIGSGTVEGVWGKSRGSE